MHLLNPLVLQEATGRVEERRKLHVFFASSQEDVIWPEYPFIILKWLHPVLCLTSDRTRIQLYVSKISNSSNGIPVKYSSPVF